MKTLRHPIRRYPHSKSPAAQVPPDIPELPGPLGCAPSLAPGDGHTTSQTRTETSFQLKSQSSNLSNASDWAYDGSHVNVM